MERQGRLRRRWIFKPTGTGNQGVILFWDETLEAYVPTETSEVIWDDTAKILKPVALTVAGCTVLGLNSAVFQPTTDSTTFFQVLDADGGTPLLNIDTTDERVIIGGDTPVIVGNLKKAIFSVYSPETDGTALFAARAPTDQQANFILQANANFRLSAPIFKGERSRDTAASPAPVQDTDILFNLTGSGWDGSSYKFASNIDMEAAGTFSASSRPSRIIFRTMAVGTTTIQTRVTVDSTGNIGFGETAPETLLEMTGATPYLTLHNDTHEDSDGGRESRLNFKGEQTGGEKSTLARVEVGHDGAVDDEKGYWDLFINDGNDGDTPTKAVRVDSTGLVITGPGTLFLNETTTPTALADHGALYTTSDNELFFQDGNGVEHLLHGDAFSNIWFASPLDTGEVIISAQNAFTVIDSFTVVGHEDDLLNVVGSTSTNSMTLSSIGAGEYEVSYHGSITASGGVDKKMMFNIGITLATPKDITDVTDDLVTPIVITSVAHGLENGDMVEIVGVLGNTAADGSYFVAGKTDDTFQIVALDNGATTGNGDYDAGSPTGDITIEYPGNMMIRRSVRGDNLGAVSATGIHILANSDVLKLYVANLINTTNLTVASMSFEVHRFGD